MAELFALLLAAAMGASLGSFLNVVIDRLPEGQSIVFPGSHCPGCARPLRPLELVPVASYLWLRGRCRTCRAPIGARTPAVEAASGLVVAGLWQYWGPDPRLLWAVAVALVGLALLVIDVERRLLPDVLVAVLAGLAAVALAVGIGRSSPTEAVLGALSGLALLGVPALLWPRAFGLGDAKLAGALGLGLGYPWNLIGLFLGVVLGACVAATLLGMGRIGRRSPFPLGPFLLLGAGLSGPLGPDLLDLYLQTLFASR